MNAQEIYDKVARHLLTQNARSLVGSGLTPTPFCAYRGPHGRMCAAGCLLTDAEAIEADGRDENTGWYSIRQVMDLSRFDGHHDLIEELQDIHDRSEPEAWGVLLAQLADRHSLSTGVLR